MRHKFEVKEMIQRNYYLDRLIRNMWNGEIKVITGIRRCGKSVLLFELFDEYLRNHGTDATQIIKIELDQRRYYKYRNPITLCEYVEQLVLGQQDKKLYLFIDEVQLTAKVIDQENGGIEVTIYDMLNELKAYKNLDVYVTGSNSKMLSSDILTEFRGRSDEIRVHPLSFAEFYSAVGGDKQDAFDNYAFYGGIPLILSRPNDAAKMAYLKSLFSEVYLKDIVERKKIKREDVLSAILDLLCSSIGSLTNPTKVAATINTVQKRSGENVVALNTVKAYMDHLSDFFLFTECKRWDVKGKSYFDYPNKYYCEDIGLRNARIGLRQQEMTHIMENIIFNELMIRECSVDIGIVYGNEKNAKGRTTPVAREIDFIAASGGKKTYIQSAYALGTEEKAITENKPFALTGDSFPKIIVRHDIHKRWYDDNGILNVGVIDFLLDDTLV